ncbi:MAG: AraC family transcriptional regulator [Paracoccaceae bacterium]|nr:AraC family transcriptional regulator [Paracoccaceae bacterium]
MMALVVTRPWLTHRAKILFATLAVLMIVETVLVSLRFAYQIGSVLALQRLLPFWIGPLLYLGYVALSDRAERMQMIMLGHLSCAAVINIVIASIPQTRVALDLLIGLSYATYAVFLMRLWRGGPDLLSQLPVAHIPKMRRLLLLGVLLLAVTCVMDTVIAVDFARNAGENVSRLLSIGSAILILSFCIAAFWVARAPKHIPLGVRAPEDQDTAILRQATRFLHESRLFTDPDLSLTRLARRIGVTDRALSTAINRETGNNVSQFINGFRVAEAARLLRATKDPVGTIGEASGFLTRSNFYTEFQRVHDQSPGAYRKG